MWVFPSVIGNNNILDAGYANIDTLFVLAPWVFLFLAPAVTMRSFSEEKKTGTIELLLTHPLSDWEIIFAKYLSGVTLVTIALVPTLIYFLSVYMLGNPSGNIDVGGTFGSYIGLLFLSATFVAIGIFSSSLTDNQVIAFIISVFICFLCYIGFESVSALGLFGKADSIIIKMGINEHYISLSRGVIDSRDVVYFISIVFIFLFLTKTSLGSRKW